MFDHVVKYQELGWHLFPIHWVQDSCCSCGNSSCTNIGKHPITQHGVHDATNDLKTLYSWWRKWPLANIAVHCGASGFLVLDIDIYKDVYLPNAIEKLLSLEDENTVTGLSGGGGGHLYYQIDRKYGNHRQHLPLGIDIRAYGGYVILPPSNHKSGNVYQWEDGYSPFEIAMRPLPEKLAALLDKILDERQQATAHRCARITPELETIAEALHYIPNWSVNEREGGLEYRQWLSVLMAIHSISPDENGIALCESWSPGYDGEIEQKFKSFHSAGITLGTLEYLARQYGWQGSFDYDGFGPDAPVIIDGSDAIKPQHSTWPYAVENGQMIFKEETKRLGIVHRPISDFYATVIKEEHLETGEIIRTIEVVGVRGGTFTLSQIMPDIWGNATKLAGYIAGRISTQDRIYPRMAEHLPAAISALSNEITVKKLYERTGWLTDKFLIPGRFANGIEVRLTRTPYSWSTVAYSDEALDALITAVDTRQSLPILSYVLGAPLAQKAGWHKRYVCMAVGRSGSLKTSFSKLATNIYAGQMISDDDLQEWGKAGTLIGIIKIGVAYCDMPYLLDNYKPNTGNGEQDFIDFVQLIVEGRERTRSKRDGRLQNSDAIRTWPLVTGEDLPESDAATVARVLAVDFARTSDVRGVVRASRYASKGALGAIGVAWLEWLESSESIPIIQSVMADYDNRRDRWMVLIQAANDEVQNVLRCADNLTMNESAWLIACQHPLFGMLLRTYHNDYCEGIERCAAAVAQRTAQSLEASVWLTTISGLLAKGAITLVRPGEFNQFERDRMVGWRDDDGIYISPAMIKQMVKDIEINKITTRTLYDQLVELGHLIKDGSRSTIVKYLPGEKPAHQRVIWLKPDTFETRTLITETLAEEIGL